MYWLISALSPACSATLENQLDHILDFSLQQFTPATKLSGKT